MHLSAILLICLCILCLTRAIEAPLHRLGLSVFYVGLLSIVLLIASYYTLRPLTEFSINPAALLLVFFVGIYAGKRLDTLRILQAFAGALFAGLLMLLLSRLITAERLNLWEPGLFLGLCMVPFGWLLRREPAAALFCAALAPLILSLLEAALDLYAFGYTILVFGAPLAFDAQIAGIMLMGLLLGLKAPAPAQTGAA